MIRRVYLKSGSDKMAQLFTTMGLGLNLKAAPPSVWWINYMLLFSVCRDMYTFVSQIKEFNVQKI